MDRRHALLLSLAAAPLGACSPHSRTRAETLAMVGVVADATARAEPPAADQAPVLLASTRDSTAGARRARRDTTMGAELSVEADGGLRFALAVANPSKHRVELTFPDGRTRDFAVLDAAGREVWRWSTGRMFTQGVQARLVSAGDSVVYEGRWTRPAPGRYTVVAQLRSDNHPFERRLAFTIPAEPASPPPLSAH
jgi:hypothetical protein